MRKVSWLVAGVSILLSMVLISCGYVKKDELDQQLTDYKMETDQKVQLAQDAAVEASGKADKVLTTARSEIATAKGEAISAAEEKDAMTLASAKSSMEAGDMAVKKSAAEAANKALTDAKAAAMAEDEKVKQMAKESADRAMSAAEEADRKARRAADEAELAKELPKPKKPIVFTVYFDLGQTKLKEEGMAELERAADAIKSHPGVAVNIEGHTDNVPVIRSMKYKNNWGLSQARAQVVKNQLVEKLGVSEEVIKETMGVAFYKPVSSDSSKGRKMNRRVEVILMPGD